MAKINDGAGSGKTIPSSNEFSLKENELFKDDIDDMRGSTIAIEVVRPIKSRFNAGDTDSFETDSNIDTGANTPQDLGPEFDVEKLRKKSDTGLTVQMKRIRLQQNLKG
jgi:hypothetical protein